MITAIIFFYAFFCHSEMFCGMIVVVPIFPWSLLATGMFPTEFNSTAGLYFFASLNTVIIYFFGAFIGRMFLKWKNRTHYISVAK